MTAPATLVAGVDEAGRGPLAGPVVAAAVILDPSAPVQGLNDSKKLAPAQREALAVAIRDRALAASVAWADCAEIDRLNILQATFLAMRRALLGLSVWPDGVEVDGKLLPDLRFFHLQVRGVAIVGGDASRPAISAASILAKVARDRMMEKFDRRFPQYGFAQHKGYGTREHREKLQAHGPCAQHRRSFRPLSEWL